MKGFNKAVNKACARLNATTKREVTQTELESLIGARINVAEIIQQLEKYRRILKRDGIYLIDPTPEERLLD